MRLSAGLPGTTAGPVSPPRRAPWRESSRKPPFSSFAAAEWQPKHWAFKVGSMDSRKRRSASVSSASALSGEHPNRAASTMAVRGRAIRRSLHRDRHFSPLSCSTAAPQPSNRARASRKRRGRPAG